MKDKNIDFKLVKEEDVATVEESIRLSEQREHVVEEDLKYDAKFFKRFSKKL